MLHFQSVYILIKLLIYKLINPPETEETLTNYTKLSRIFNYESRL